MKKITITNEVNAGLKSAIMKVIHSNCFFSVGEHAVIYDSVNDCLLGFGNDNYVYSPIGGERAVDQILNGDKHQGLVLGSTFNGFMCEAMNNLTDFASNGGRIKYKLI